MSIQAVIGNRIREARKKLGLTMKELSELTRDLKASRINNWERGMRTPGPEEAKQLAKALQISAAYLLGLSDNPDANATSKVPGLVGVVPILSYEQALQPQKIIDQINTGNNHSIQFIPLGEDFKKDFTSHTFALRIKDDSMSPALSTHDLVIVNPNKTPQPGAFVIAQVAGQSEIIVRQYKQLSCNRGFESFELIPLNDKWANVIVNAPKDAKIIGVICQAMRAY